MTREMRLNEVDSGRIVWHPKQGFMVMGAFGAKTDGMGRDISPYWYDEVEVVGFFPDNINHRVALSCGFSAHVGVEDWQSHYIPVILSQDKFDEYSLNDPYTYETNIFEEGDNVAIGGIKYSRAALVQSLCDIRERIDDRDLEGLYTDGIYCRYIGNFDGEPYIVIHPSCWGVPTYALQFNAMVQAMLTVGHIFDSNGESYPVRGDESQVRIGCQEFGNTKIFLDALKALYDSKVSKLKTYELSATREFLRHDATKVDIPWFQVKRLIDSLGSFLNAP